MSSCINNAISTSCSWPWDSNLIAVGNSCGKYGNTDVKLQMRIQVDTCHPNDFVLARSNAYAISEGNAYATSSNHAQYLSTQSNKCETQFGTCLLRQLNDHEISRDMISCQASSNASQSSESRCIIGLQGNCYDYQCFIDENFGKVPEAGDEDSNEYHQSCTNDTKRKVFLQNDTLIMQCFREVHTLLCSETALWWPIMKLITTKRNSGNSNLTLMTMKQLER